MNPDPPPGADVGSAADASVTNTSISTKDNTSTVLAKSATNEPIKEDSAASEPKEKPKPITSHLPNLTPPVKKNWYGLVRMERPEAKTDTVSESSDGGTKLPSADDKSAKEEPAKEYSAVSTLEASLKPATSQLSKLALPLRGTWAGLVAGTKTLNPKYTAVKEESTSDSQEMKSATPQFSDLTTPINRTWAGLAATTKVESRMKAADSASSDGGANIPVEDQSECESPDGGVKLESILSDDEPMSKGTPVETPESTPEATENPKADDEPPASKPSTEGRAQPAADSSAPTPRAITAPVHPPPTTIPLTVNSSTSSESHPPILTTWSERIAAPQTTSNTPSSSMVSSRLSLSIPPISNSTSPPAMTSALGAPIDPAVPLSPTHLTSHLAAAASSPLAPPPGPHIQVLRIIADAPAKIVPLTLITSKWGWIVDLTPYIKTSKSLSTPVRFLDWKKDGELRVYQPFFDDELDEASGKVLKQMEEDEDNDVPLMERGPYTAVAKATRKGGCVVVKTRGRDAVDVTEKDVEGIVKMVNRLKGW